MEGRTIFMEVKADQSAINKLVYLIIEKNKHGIFFFSKYCIWFNVLELMVFNSIMEVLVLRFFKLINKKWKERRMENLFIVTNRFSKDKLSTVKKSQVIGALKCQLLILIHFSCMCANKYGENTLISYWLVNAMTAKIL